MSEPPISATPPALPPGPEVPYVRERPIRAGLVFFVVFVAVIMGLFCLDEFTPRGGAGRWVAGRLEDGILPARKFAMSPVLRFAFFSAEWIGVMFLFARVARRVKFWLLAPFALLVILGTAQLGYAAAKLIALSGGGPR